MQGTAIRTTGKDLDNALGKGDCQAASVTPESNVDCRMRAVWRCLGRNLLTWRKASRSTTTLAPTLSLCALGLGWCQWKTPRLSGLVELAFHTSCTHLPLLTELTLKCIACVTGAPSVAQLLSALALYWTSRVPQGVCAKLC